MYSISLVIRKSKIIIIYCWLINGRDWFQWKNEIDEGKAISKKLRHNFCCKHKIGKQFIDSLYSTRFTGMGRVLLHNTFHHIALSVLLFNANVCLLITAGRYITRNCFEIWCYGKFVFFLFSNLTQGNMSSYQTQLSWKEEKKIDDNFRKYE